MVERSQAVGGATGDGKPALPATLGTLAWCSRQSTSSRGGAHTQTLCTRAGENRPRAWSQRAFAVRVRALARARISDAPDFLASVVRNQHRAVFQNQQTHRAAPYLAAALIQHPAVDEIIVAAHRPAVFETDAHNLVTCAL